MALIGKVQLKSKVIKIKRTTTVDVEVSAGDEVYHYTTWSCPGINADAASTMIVEALAVQGYQISSHAVRSTKDVAGFSMELGEVLMQQVDANAREDPGITASLEFTLRSKGGVIKDGSGCFIATACYGNDKHPDVVLFRCWRDKVLLQSPVGQVLVQFYYFTSPPVAGWIERMPQFAAMIRRVAFAPLARRLRKQPFASD
jgi:hypothetical protein